MGTFVGSHKFYYNRRWEQEIILFLNMIVWVAVYYWNIEWWTHHLSYLILFSCCICIVCILNVQGIYRRLISFGKKHPIQMLLYEQKRWTRSLSLSLLWDQNAWGMKCSHIYKVSRTENPINAIVVGFISSPFSHPQIVLPYFLAPSLVTLTLNSLILHNNSKTNVIQAVLNPTQPQPPP